MTRRFSFSEEVRPDNDAADEEGADATGEREKQEGESGDTSATVFVVVVGLLVLTVGLGIVVFGLHYKRKLPPRVYAFFSRTHWKPVAGNDEVPVSDAIEMI